jgi:hypothetical protein
MLVFLSFVDNTTTCLRFNRLTICYQIISVRLQFLQACAAGILSPAVLSKVLARLAAGMARTGCCKTSSRAKKRLQKPSIVFTIAVVVVLSCRGIPLNRAGVIFNNTPSIVPEILRQSYLNDGKSVPPHNASKRSVVAHHKVIRQNMNLNNAFFIAHE